MLCGNISQTQHLWVLHKALASMDQISSRLAKSPLIDRSCNQRDQCSNAVMHMHQRTHGNTLSRSDDHFNKYN